MVVVGPGSAPAPWLDMSFEAWHLWNTESRTTPYFTLLTESLFRQTLMDLRSVHDIIRDLRSCGRRDSTALSFGNKSGLIDVPGDWDHLYLWYRINCTSHALVGRTSIGCAQLSLYLPNLKQSQIEHVHVVSAFCKIIRAIVVGSVLPLSVGTRVCCSVCKTINGFQD